MKNIPFGNLSKSPFDKRYRKGAAAQIWTAEAAK